MSQVIQGALSSQRQAKTSPLHYTMKTNPYDPHTIHEQLLIAEIRVMARKYELKLLKAAHRKGLLPTPKELVRRIVRDAFAAAISP